MNQLVSSLSAFCLLSCVVMTTDIYSQTVALNREYNSSQKILNGNGNPLLDYHFTADPTAVEHEGRLYVYATNDHQQYEAVGRDGKNTYEKIKSLVMMSTDDMANWTYHGIIDVESIAPWIIASWAPSVVKRKEADGKTHFYLYFSNSGYGTGVITATSPVGPWTSPLDSSLVDGHTPGLGDCKVPFDPGAVIDDNGIGWLSIGAGNAVVLRLGDDMTSIASEMVALPAPHHFEANELNYINGTYVYTYNTDWNDHSDWPYPGDVPTRCSMYYLTSRTPLDPDSWKHGRNYLKNSGDYGFSDTNNHTHLHKYGSRWYILYHSMELQKSFGTSGGFRNVCVDEIEVDENNVEISMGRQSLEGPRQIKPVDPFVVQQAETTSATECMAFAPSGVPGNMIASNIGDKGVTTVKGVAFGKQPRLIEVKASGKGTIEVRENSTHGNLIATIHIDTPTLKLLQSKATLSAYNTPADLCFVLKGDIKGFDHWQFK